MEVKEQIIIAADELFMRYGIRSITMDDIAKHLSISKKTIYQFYKDKNEIVCQVTEAHLEREKKEFCGIVKDSENAVQMLFLISKCIRNNVATMNPSLLFDLQKYHVKAWKIFLTYKEKIFKNNMINALERGIQEGYFRTDIVPRVLATMRMEQVQMAFNDQVFPRAEFDFTQVQMQLFDHFMHGITTTKGQELFNNYLENNKNE